MLSLSVCRISRVISFTAFLLVVLICCSDVSAQDCIDYAGYAPLPAPLVGGIPGFGQPIDISVSGTRVYVASSHSVMAFDSSDPVKPQFLGEAEHVSLCLLADGHTVYGLDEDGNLLVMDFSDPAHPQTSQHFLATTPSSGCLALADNVLYLALNYYPFSGYLFVMDVSDPASPVVQAQRSTYLCSDISLSGSHAFMAMNYGESNQGFLGVMDISDPADPHLAAQLELGLAPNSVVVTTPYAYVATPTGIRVVDISNPVDPQILDPVSGLISTWNLELTGSQLVCWGIKYGQDDPGLRVLDLAQPEAPVFVGSQETVPSNSALACNGSVVYAVSNGWGLRVYSIADPARPELDPWTYGMPGICYDSVANATHAFLAGYDLRVVEIIDPSQPELVKTFPMPNFGADVCLVDDTLVWAGSMPPGNGSGLMTLVGIQDPESPVVRGSVVLPDYPLEIAAFGFHAYGASQSSDVLIVDITDVDNPIYVGNVEIPDSFCQTITIFGSLAYVGAGSFLGAGGLYILDLSDPINPEIIGHLAQGSVVGDVMVDGDRACMINKYDSSVLLVDVSDPTNPQLIHREESFGVVTSLFFQEPRLYIGSYEEMRVVDVTDPLQLTTVGNVEFMGYAYEITRIGSTVGIAAGFDGYFLAGLDCAGVAGVGEDRPALIPTEALLGSYPNPFNPLISISYRLDQPGPLRLAVHDLRGRLVRILEEGNVGAGQRTLTWSGIDQEGRAVPSGTYFLKLTSSSGTDVQKVSLVR